MSTVNNQLNSATVLTPINQGGTGLATLTNSYAPVCAGSSPTGTLLTANTGLSTSGFVLTSTGASSLPQFSAFPITINRTQVTLTPTQIINMYTTPVQLIASQGAHKVILILAVTQEYIFNTIAYTGTNDDGPVLQYGSQQHAGGLIVFISTMDITLSNSQVYYGPPNGSFELGTFPFPSVVGTNTQIPNVGIYATTDMTTYASGNGTLRYTIDYIVFTTTI